MLSPPVRTRVIGAPPLPRGAAARPRLHALLNDGGTLTVVRGASGSGKTVAIRSWVETASATVLWISADDGVVSSADLAETVCRRLPAGEFGSADRRDWPAVRESLRSTEAPVIIVLDEAARFDPEALREICSVAAGVAGVRVVAAETRTTVLDEDGMDLLVDRSIVGPMDLMFDVDEVVEALGVERDIAEGVQRETSGFPTLIAAIRERGLPRRGGSVLDATADAVENYLRMRVGKAGYDPAFLEALVRVSIADVCDEHLVRELDVDVDAAAVLCRAEESGFGHWQAADEHRFFLLLPFAKVLFRRELMRRPASERSRMRTTAVHWALRSGQPREALRLALDEDDALQLANHVVKSSWYHLITHDGRAVRELLSAVPVAILRQQPLLLMLLAICYNAVRVRRIRGLQLFRMAVSAANSHRSDLDSMERLFIRSAESAALRILGMTDRAAKVAVQALRLLVELPEEEYGPFADELPMVCAQLGVSLFYGGHRRQATDAFAYGAAFAATGVRERGLSCLAMLSGIHALHGDLPEAQHYVELIREGEWRADLLDGYSGTFYRVAEALIALEESDPDRAASHVAKFVPHRATSEHWLVMATTEALVQLHLRGPDEGLVRLDAFEALRGREAHSAVARHRLGELRSLLHLAAGDRIAAASVLRHDADMDPVETTIERARLALVDDRPGEVIRLLSRIRQPMTPRLRTASCVLRTAALLRNPEGISARHEAQELLALLRETRLRTPLQYLPPEDLAAVRELFPDDARELLPVTSVLPSAGLAVKLTRRERIVLQAIVSGRKLPDVAADLGVSMNTLKTQLRSVYRKLGVSGRSEAVDAAMARNLLSH